MNRAITYPVAVAIWAAAVTGWAIALPIAAAGAALHRALRP